MTRPRTVRPRFTARQLALHAARLIWNKAGEDLVVLQLPPACGAAFDFVVLVTGRSERQCFALVDEVNRFCKRHGVAHRPVEGKAGWMLVDCGDVVVHAFLAEHRTRFALEELWPGAKHLNHVTAFKRLADPDQPAAATREDTPEE